MQPQYSETYTLLTLSDDTVRVWLDGKVVIDNTTPHGPALDKATVTLTAGRKYAIRVDYTQHGGEAYLKLFWYSPNQGQRILPASQLYSS